MKTIYKRIFMLLTAVIIAVISALPVSADMGPKPSIMLTVENAPEESYYIDLLCETHPFNDRDDYKSYRSEHTEAERKMMETVDAYVSEEGYGARHGCPIEPPYRHSNDKNRYEFSYMNVPENFRVIIVTESGQVYVSELCKRHAFNAYMTYDVQSGKVSEEPVGFIVPLAVKLFITCTATVAIESFIFLLFKFKFGEGHNRAVIWLTNIATQIMLYIAIEIELEYFLFAELAIMVLEAFIYSGLLRPKSSMKAFVYGITANLLSFLLGIPMWLIVTFIIPT